MTGWLGDWFFWVKAFHILAIIAWMAGMLYLPRLFIYHTGVAVGSEASETFKVMERRLLRAIINPSMGLAWILGLGLVAHLDAWGDTWMQVKFILVLLLSAQHGWLSRWRKDFARDQNRHSARFYRFMNEVPTVLMIGIVIFVVVKPFA